MNQIIEETQRIVCLAPKTRLQMAEEFKMIDVRQLIPAVLSLPYLLKAKKADCSFQSPD